MVTTVGIMSDFSADYYQGVMKAVVTQSNIPLNFVDLPVNHPHSIINASWILVNSLPYFPKNSVFLVVIDPGVGTLRRPLIVKISDHWLVLPDNGIITPFKDQLEAAYVIQSNQNISSTFHGRDLFSPAVRDIIIGRELSEFSTAIESSELTFLDDKLRVSEKTGIITDIDSFGNIITNIAIKEYQISDELSLVINNTDLHLDLVHTFSDLPQNKIGGIIGSCNTLELVINQGSASHLLDASIGDIVIIL